MSQKFVFTDINSEPIDPKAQNRNSSGSRPVKVSSSDDDRFQMYEINLDGSSVKLPEEPARRAPAPQEPVSETYSAPRTGAKAPDVSSDDGEYEVDFGYATPGALDDVTFPTAPTRATKQEEPKTVSYRYSDAPAGNDDEYYDSYKPMDEESYGPGAYFAQGDSAPNPPKASKTVRQSAQRPASQAYRKTAPNADAAEPVKVYNDAGAAKTYQNERPRYENYRKNDRRASPYEEPRTYENNIDDSVFLPDEGELPMDSRRHRRRLTIAIIAIVVAILILLGAVLINHFTGDSGKKEDATTDKSVKTTEFVRSVSNNEDVIDDEPSDTTELTETPTYGIVADQSTSRSTRASSRATTARRTTARSTTRRSTTRSTRTATRSTTAQTTTRATQTTTHSVPPTATPSTNPPTHSTTAAPSPWDHVSH